MGGNNLFLKRIHQERENAMSVTERVTRQMMVDTLQVTLHEHGWGYDRIKALCDLWSDNYKEYSRALMPKRDPEADAAQEHLDRALADILKGKQALIPFYERYPDIQLVHYEGRRR